MVSSLLPAMSPTQFFPSPALQPQRTDLHFILLSISVISIIYIIINQLNLIMNSFVMEQITATNVFSKLITDPVWLLVTKLAPQV